MSCSTSAISGSYGAITGITGTEIKSWTANINVEILDASSMASNSYMEYVFGLASCDGSFTAIGTPPTYGEETGVEFSTGQTAGDLIISGDILIGQVAVNTDVAGVVEYTATYNFCGGFTVGTQ